MIVNLTTICVIKICQHHDLQLPFGEQLLSDLHVVSALAYKLTNPLPRTKFQQDKEKYIQMRDNKARTAVPTHFTLSKMNCAQH